MKNLHHGVAGKVALCMRLRCIAQVVSLATCLEKCCSTCQQDTKAGSAQIRQVGMAPAAASTQCHLQGCDW